VKFLARCVGDQELRANAAASFHHVGVILPSRDLIGAYRDLTRLEISCDEYVEPFDCDCIFLGDRKPMIELIVPRGGRLAEFNQGSGGIHHCAFQVADLSGFMAEYVGGKGRWLHPSPVAAARGMLVNFLAARHLGSLTEFVQERNGWT
jgi:methylmalonyl-CoA/ethylmalonyl-CoA epimerase